MQILFCASEAAPFASTGGLGEVTGSLPVALGRLGARVRLVLPKYRGLTADKKRLSPNVTAHFIEQEAYFNRHSPYGNGGGDYPDNLERFSYFCDAALRLAKRIGFKPDVVHAHDWQTALLPVFLKTKFAKDPFFAKTKTVLTIHNVAYQGQFSSRQFPVLGLDPSLLSLDGFEFYGKINVLKAGILFADRLTTVSPGYAREITTREYGFGLDGVLRRRQKDLTGILNGIDTDVWDPSGDRHLVRRYSLKNPEGKALCKAALQRQCGFEEDASVPVFGMVTRLAEQKGLDLLVRAADAILRKRLQFVLLGDGDHAYHSAFREIGARYRGNAAVAIGFDAARAHAIYAGSDFFMMPSLFEPCGLGQLISFRYGTVPIVRATGGLADTVHDADADRELGNGFVFRLPDGGELETAVDRALSAFADTRRMDALRRRVMHLDFSWRRSAGDYLAFYRKTLGPERRS